MATNRVCTCDKKHDDVPDVAEQTGICETCEAPFAHQDSMKKKSNTPQVWESRPPDWDGPKEILPTPAKTTRPPRRLWMRLLCAGGIIYAAYVVCQIGYGMMEAGKSRESELRAKIEALEQSSGEVYDLAILYHDLGHLLIKEKRMEEAAEALHGACSGLVAMRRPPGDATHVILVTDQLILADCLFAVQRYEEAAIEMRACIKTYEQEFPAQLSADLYEQAATIISTDKPAVAAEMRRKGQAQPK